MLGLHILVRQVYSALDKVSTDGDLSLWVANCSYLQEYRFDVSKLEPVVAKVWIMTFPLTYISNSVCLAHWGTVGFICPFT